MLERDNMCSSSIEMLLHIVHIVKESLPAPRDAKVFQGCKPPDELEQNSHLALWDETARNVASVEYVQCTRDEGDVDT